MLIFLYKKKKKKMLPSYRNQSIDLWGKLIDWFLYDGVIGREWVKLWESD